jgi:hypothetical protein
VNKDKRNQSAKPELPTKLNFGVDTAGMWFSAIVLFAVLAAGIIIFRAGTTIFALRRIIAYLRQPRVCDSLSGS